jgi:hypothetical protein
VLYLSFAKATALAAATLIASGLLIACSKHHASPPLPPPPALWAAYGQGEDDVGFALRVEPGAGDEPWVFNIGGTRLYCEPVPAADGWHFEDCSSFGGWLASATIDVPAKEGEPLRLTLKTSDDYELSTQLKRVPERDEPDASDNVELVWKHAVFSTCGSYAGVWAEGGLVFGACWSGVVEILDGATGRVLGTADVHDAPLGEDSAALEVTARDGILYVATTGRGVVTFDVSDPRNPRQAGQFYVDEGQASPNSVTNIHTLTLSPDGRLLFAINQTHPRSDVRIIDVSDPANLHEAGVYIPPPSPRAYGFSHDISLEERDGKLIGYYYQLAGGMRILDATDPASVKEAGALEWPRTFSHSGWPFEANGRRYLAHADEGYDQGLTVIDVTNVAEPRIVSTYKTREGISIHNLRVVDGVAFISYYIDGLRILDLRDPEKPREIGHYDTVPPEEETGIFDGAWGVDLDNGLIYVSDRGNGIFAFRFSGAP